MRNRLLPAVALAVIGFTAPVFAADIGYVRGPVTEVYTLPGPLPVQAAIDIANRIGMVFVSSANKWFDEWQIEGHDISGRHMEVDVNRHTGAIVDVDK